MLLYYLSKHLARQCYKRQIHIFTVDILKLNYFFLIYYTKKKRLLIKHHSYIKVKSEGSKEKADTENEKIGRKQNNTSKKIFF